jgi:hypothetical protein
MTDTARSIRHLPPGSVFRCRSGDIAVKSEYKLRPEDPHSPWECIIVGSGEFYHGQHGDDDTVEPIDIPALLAEVERLRALMSLTEQEAAILDTEASLYAAALSREG